MMRGLASLLVATLGVLLFVGANNAYSVKSVAGDEGVSNDDMRDTERILRSAVEDTTSGNRDHGEGGHYIGKRNIREWKPLEKAFRNIVRSVFVKSADARRRSVTQGGPIPISRRLSSKLAPTLTSKSGSFISELPTMTKPLDSVNAIRQSSPDSSSPWLIPEEPSPLPGEPIEVTANLVDTVTDILSALRLFAEPYPRPVNRNSEALNFDKARRKDHLISYSQLTPISALPYKGKSPLPLTTALDLAKEKANIIETKTYRKDREYPDDDYYYYVNLTPNGQGSIMRHANSDFADYDMSHPDLEERFSPTVYDSIGDITITIENTSGVVDEDYLRENDPCKL